MVLKHQCSLLAFNIPAICLKWYHRPSLFCFPFVIITQLSHPILAKMFRFRKLEKSEIKGKAIKCNQISSVVSRQYNVSIQCNGQISRCQKFSRSPFVITNHMWEKINATRSMVCNLCHGCY